VNKEPYSDELIKRAKNIKTDKNITMYKNTEKLFEELGKKEKLEKLKAHQDVEFCELDFDDCLTDI